MKPSGIYLTIPVLKMFEYKKKFYDIISLRMQNTRSQLFYRYLPFRCVRLWLESDVQTKSQRLIFFGAVSSASKVSHYKATGKLCSGGCQWPLFEPKPVLYQQVLKHKSLPPSFFIRVTQHVSLTHEFLFNIVFWIVNLTFQLMVLWSC